MRQFSILIFAMVLVGGLSVDTPEIQAQTSIGYSDPEDISNLLDYRLPDWSYRVWDLGFGMVGGNSSSRMRGEDRSTGDFSGKLGSEFSQTWESEDRYINIWTKIDGEYSRFYYNQAHYESLQHQLDGQFGLSFRVEQYLGGGPFSLRVSGSTDIQYDEVVNHDEDSIAQDDFGDYTRDSRHEISVGPGWGRLRNVVPLLRAQRLSERLMTMGRPGLDPRQIQEVARVLATEYAYRKVFDRGDRRFWSDVLAPMMVQDNPLSPFEIFYLTDVLNEYLGERVQGFEVVLQGAYREYYSESYGSVYQSNVRSTDFGVNFFHNFSLTQQLKISGRFYYYWLNSGYGSNDDGHFKIEVAHLWNLADRQSLSTYFTYMGNLFISDNFDTCQMELGSTFRVFVEDRISLTTNVKCGYYQTDYFDEVSFGWNWRYSLGLEYHIDRLIF